MLNNALPYLGLLYMGGAWGLGFSLAKLAAVDGTTPIGIAFWQCILAGLLLLVFVFFRRTKISLSWQLIKLYLIVGLLGAAIPTTCFHCAALKRGWGEVEVNSWCHELMNKCFLSLPPVCVLHGTEHAIKRVSLIYGFTI